MYRTVFWTLWERVRVGWFGRMALKHVNYHMWNKSPVQVRGMIQGARGWCTGMTQRDGTGKDVGGGFRMGNTCIPVADSFRYMAKPIQYCKVKNKIKLNTHTHTHTHTKHPLQARSCWTGFLLLWEKSPSHKDTQVCFPRDFPGDPVFKILPLSARGVGSIPGWS